jgi:hypothetical protein
MSNPMERPTGAVEEQQHEGDSPPLSPPGSGGQTSSGIHTAKARLKVAEMIEQAVTEAVERRFQSAKDKRWAELEKQYSSLSELAEKLGEVQGQPEDEPQPADPAVTAQDLTGRVQALARLPGLKENETIRALLLRHARPESIEDYTNLLEDLLRLGVAGRLADENNRASTPASAVIPGGSDAPADLQQAYPPCAPATSTP